MPTPFQGLLISQATVKQVARRAGFLLGVFFESEDIGDMFSPKVS